MDVEFHSLVNTTGWQIVNFLHSCPEEGINDPISAGSYNFYGFIYLNTLNNYNDSNYPEIISFNIHTTLNTPQYSSNDYNVNLADNMTYFSQPGTSNNGITLLFPGIVTLSLGIAVIEGNRRFFKNKN